MRFVCLIAIVLLAGCVFTKPDVDLQQTQLMPREVAMKIVTRYAGANWATRPALRKPENCPEPRWVPIGYSDINHVFYDRIGGKVWVTKLGENALFGCPANVGMQTWIGVANQTEAQELASALVSLGATLQK